MPLGELIGLSRYNDRRHRYGRKTNCNEVDASSSENLLATERMPVSLELTFPLWSIGRVVDYGSFCSGCWDETDKKTMHYRIRYTTDER